MSFDYAHTCPDIDREINNAKDNIETSIENIVEELCPYMDLTSKMTNEFISSQSEDLYDQLEGCFESVRQTNENMRSEAEYQIDQLTEEYEEKIAGMQDEIDMLSKELETADI